MVTADSRRKHAAFTLTELMVVAAVSGLLLLGVLSTNLHLWRTGARITHYAEMESQVRRALDQLGRDLKNATAVKWNGASDLTLTLPSLAGTTSQVTYAWTAAAQSFYLVTGADSAGTAGRIVLVPGVPAQAGGAAGLTFARFDRDGNAATTDLGTKMIQVNLVPRRETTGAAATEIISATFTLRNKPTS
jgi:prepilin-type N-terminal cleavage/methylation domain-containing protein